MLLLRFLSVERGRGARLAAAIGVHPVLITQWSGAVRPVPVERCPQIERATQGEVTCEELRTDAHWVRVADPDWPHPDGRPLLDVAREKVKEGAAE